MLQIKTLRNPRYQSFSQLLLCPEVVKFLFTGIKLNLWQISTGVERVSYNRSLKNIHLSTSNQISNTAQIQNKTLTKWLSVGGLFCVVLLYGAQIAMSPSETVSQNSLLPDPAKACGFFFRRPATVRAVLWIHQVLMYSCQEAVLLNSTSQTESRRTAGATATTFPHLPAPTTGKVTPIYRVYPLKQKAQVI